MARLITPGSREARIVSISALSQEPPFAAAILILGPYGLIYFAGAWLMKIPEAQSTFNRLRHR